MSPSIAETKNLKKSASADLEAKKQACADGKLRAEFIRRHYAVLQQRRREGAHRTRREEAVHPERDGVDWFFEWVSSKVCF